MSHDADQVCRCQSVHRPAPLELHAHHVLPLSLGGSEAEENVVYVCPTTHQNIHELMRLMFRAGFSIPTSELDESYDVPVNRYAAELARRGYEAAAARLRWLG